MKIIKMGNVPKEKKVKCKRCKTEFTYIASDVKSDPRDGSYVICPNKLCKAFIHAEIPT